MYKNLCINKDRLPDMAFLEYSGYPHAEPCMCFR